MRVLAITIIAVASLLLGCAVTPEPYWIGPFPGYHDDEVWDVAERVLASHFELGQLDAAVRVIRTDWKEGETLAEHFRRRALVELAADGRVRLLVTRQENVARHPMTGAPDHSAPDWANETEDIEYAELIRNRIIQNLPPKQRR